MSAAAYSPLAGLSGTASQGRSWQHAVLAGNPALAAVPQKSGNGFLHRSGADYTGVTNFNERRAFCHGVVVGSNLYGTHLLGSAVITAIGHLGILLQRQSDYAEETK